MNDDERTVQALREALDERAALVDPADRLAEILERARPTRTARPTRWWVPLAAAAAVLAVVAGVWAGLPDRPDPVPGGGTRPSASPSTGSTTGAPSPTPSPSTRPADTGALAALPVYYLAPIGDDARMARLYREWLTAPGVAKDADEQVRARTAVGLAMTAVPTGTDGYLRTWEGSTCRGRGDRAAHHDHPLRPRHSGLSEDTARVSVQQLVWTAQAAVGRGTLPVRFVLADGSDAMFGSQPVDRSYDRPTSRDLYYEDLAPVWVTSPTRGQVLEPGPVTVQGGGVRLRGHRVVGAAPRRRRRRLRVRHGQHRRTGSRHLRDPPRHPPVPGSYAVRVFEVSPQDGAVSAETTMPFTVR